MPITRKSLENAKPLSNKQKAMFKNLKDEDIDFSDIPELDNTFWKNARLVAPSKPQQNN